MADRATYDGSHLTPDGLRIFPNGNVMDPSGRYLGDYHRPDEGQLPSVNAGGGTEQFHDPGVVPGTDNPNEGAA